MPCFARTYQPCSLAASSWASTCRQVSQPRSRSTPAAPPPPAVESSWAVVNVEPGDTLWDILARHYGGATVELVWATVAANPEIDDPNLIFVGQQIVLPQRPDTAVVPPVEPTEPVPPVQ